MKLIYKYSPYMLNIRINFVFVVLFFCNFSVLAVTYTYNGPEFQQVTGPITEQNNLSGSVQFEQPLAANLGFQNVASLVTDYEFTDGFRTFSNDSNSEIIFYVTTNESGALTSWILLIRELPLPTAVGETSSAMQAFKDPTIWYDSSFNGDCLNYNLVSESCSDVDITLFYREFLSFEIVFNQQADSRWSVTGLPPQVVPSSTIYSLIMMLLFIAMIALNKLYSIE